MSSVLSWLLLALAVAGCGTEAQSDAPPDSTLDAPTLATGAPFMCGTCKCDGRTAFCAKVITGPYVAGQWDDAVDGPACPIGSTVGAVACTPYGSDCGSSPSCACIHPIECSPSQIAHGCFERDGGVGIEIRCGGVGP